MEWARRQALWFRISPPPPNRKSRVWVDGVGRSDKTKKNTQSKNAPPPPPAHYPDYFHPVLKTSSWFVCAEQRQPVGAYTYTQTLSASSHTRDYTPHTSSLELRNECAWTTMMMIMTALEVVRWGERRRVHLRTIILAFQKCVIHKQAQWYKQKPHQPGSKWASRTKTYH